MGRGAIRNEADSPMSILIVEDDPLVASTIREVLGALGFAVAGIGPPVTRRCGWSTSARHLLHSSISVLSARWTGSKLLKRFARDTMCR